MKLDKRDKDWILKNEQIIVSILNKRVDDLKDELLEAPEGKRGNIIFFIKEFKAGIDMIKELDVNKKDTWTGI